MAEYILTGVLSFAGGIVTTLALAVKLSRTIGK